MPGRVGMFGLLRFGYLGRGDDGRSGVALVVHRADELAAGVMEMLHATCEAELLLCCL